MPNVCTWITLRKGCRKTRILALHFLKIVQCTLHDGNAKPEVQLNLSPLSPKVKSKMETKKSDIGLWLSI